MVYKQRHYTFVVAQQPLPTSLPSLSLFPACAYLSLCRAHPPLVIMHLTRRCKSIALLVFGVQLLRATPVKHFPQIRSLVVGAVHGKWDVRTLVIAVSRILSRQLVARAYRDSVRTLWHPEPCLLMRVRRLAPATRACAHCLSFEPCIVYDCGHAVCAGCVEVCIQPDDRLTVERCPACAVDED